ncbi:branched-chain amino acid aminotransferase [Parasporobacterium paucivorans]|uniref:Branched-chain-amino-acid aminotransferase n=1 Tax=Parasporobacterium paucivorans DSM 15970 TaxID=1122934 RepID=A0A1M6C9B1_9FIRM|nr:branched-chain amino acid aminotransferase [Parasporobacterium paucivorans]SHI57391.1 branched chain amino acid aminotransferase apoenzyme [Parasporobacterium paucivorans DSM 15970]
MINIRIEKTATPKTLPSQDNPLNFGTIFTDHMFIMNYDPQNGWNDARVVPYEKICLEPSSMVFHYGQEMFEGLKAYKTGDERILLFRPEKNAQRANNTNKRLCIPEIPVEDFVEAVKTLVKTDEKWVPTKEGTSLYIRPFIIATDPFLGVRPSDTYMFIIILSPVGAYYPEGLNPVRIWIEDEYVRAVKGGIGETKTGGNYVASMKSQVKAHDAGYSQVLWLDGVHRKYIEEVGAMNIFFKINGEVVTPALSGSILPGVTRDTVLELCKAWGVPASEKRISIDEIYEAYENGTLEEVFGTGTAAVISPVGELKWGDKTLIVNDGKIGDFSRKFYDTVTGIQLGNIKDEFGWTVEV